METLITAITSVLAGGGTEAVLSLGWLLFLLERYYVTPKREHQFRLDLSTIQQHYKELGDNMTTAMSKFAVLLEVIKDRGDR